MAEYTYDRSLAKTHYGAVKPGASAALPVSDGILVPYDTLIPGTSQPLLNKASNDTGTAVGTVLISNKFTYKFPYEITAALRIRARVKWEVLLATAGPAGSQVRVNLTANKSGAAISGVVAGNGPNRPVDAAYTYAEDNLVCEIPSTTYKAGETLDAIIEFENRAVVVGTSLTLYLYADPASVGNELIIEPNLG